MKVEGRRRGGRRKVEGRGGWGGGQLALLLNVRGTSHVLDVPGQQYTTSVELPYGPRPGRVFSSETDPALERVR